MVAAQLLALASLMGAGLAIPDHRLVNPSGSGLGSSAAVAGESGRAHSSAGVSDIHCAEVTGPSKFALGAVIRYDALPASHFAVVVDEQRAIGYDGAEVVYEPIRTCANRHRQPQNEEHAQAIVQRAKSRLGERSYNLIFENCETFADWCYSGSTKTPESGQAKVSATVGSSIVAVGAGALAGATTQILSVGGFWGLLGYTTTAIAWGPVGALAAVGGAAGYGGYELVNYLYHSGSE